MAPLEPGPGPTLRVEPDGSVVTLDAMPDVLAISIELLETAGRPADLSGSPVLERRGDIVDIQLANGRWVYEIREWRDEGATAICEIRYREDVECER